MTIDPVKVSQSAMIQESGRIVLSALEHGIILRYILIPCNVKVTTPSACAECVAPHTPNGMMRFRYRIATPTIQCCEHHIQSIPRILLAIDAACCLFSAFGDLGDGGFNKLMPVRCLPKA